MDDFYAFFDFQNPDHFITDTPRFIVFWVTSRSFSIL